MCWSYTPKGICVGPTPQGDVCWSYTPRGCVLVLHPKGMCAGPTPQGDVCWSYTPRGCVLVLHPKGMCAGPTPQGDVCWSYTPRGCVLVLHPKGMCADPTLLQKLAGHPSLKPALTSCAASEQTYPLRKGSVVESWLSNDHTVVSCHSSETLGPC